MAEQSETTDQMAKDAAPQKAPLTDAQARANWDRIQTDSFNRQKARRAAEDRVARDKAGKIATIMATVKALAPRHICDGLSIWIHLSCADHSAAIRPSSQDEFFALLFEMIHTGRLGIITGNLSSPLNELRVKVLEYRID